MGTRKSTRRRRSWNGEMVVWNAFVQKRRLASPHGVGWGGVEIQRWREGRQAAACAASHS